MQKCLYFNGEWNILNAIPRTNNDKGVFENNILQAHTDTAVARHALKQKTVTKQLMKTWEFEF